MNHTGPFSMEVSIFRLAILVLIHVSKCEELIAKLSLCDSKLEVTPNDADTLKEKTTLQTEKELHQRKANIFYARKRTAREKLKADKSTVAVAFDFQQELHVPNITTNDVVFFFLIAASFLFTLSIFMNSAATMSLYTPMMKQPESEDRMTWRTCCTTSYKHHALMR